jgi:hypothetical protein
VTLKDLHSLYDKCTAEDIEKCELLLLEVVYCSVINKLIDLTSISLRISYPVVVKVHVNIAVVIKMNIPA